MDGVPTNIGNIPLNSNAGPHQGLEPGLNQQKYSSMCAAERMDRERYYATVRKPSSQEQSLSPTSELDRIPEYSEDIYPYATFHLPDQSNLSSGHVVVGRHGVSSNIPKFI